MKKLAVILFGLLIISCNCDDRGEVILPDDYVSAKLNNVNWSGKPSTYLDNATDTLTLLGVGSGPKEEVVGMKIKFNGTGSYTVVKNQAFAYTTIGRDVLTSDYRLAPNTSGKIEITLYDEATGLLEGNFEVSLNKVRSNPENYIPVFNFTSGKFKARVDN